MTVLNSFYGELRCKLSSCFPPYPITEESFDNVTIAYRERITELEIDDCLFWTDIPENLTRIFPAIEKLTITNSKLNYINNLEKFGNLREFISVNNSEKVLTQKSFPKPLDKVSMIGNQLMYVDPAAFDNVKELKLQGNCETQGQWANYWMLNENCKDFDQLSKHVHKLENENVWLMFWMFALGIVLVGVIIYCTCCK